MPTGLFDGGKSSIDVSSSKVTLVCIKLNYHSHCNIKLNELGSEWGSVIEYLTSIYKVLGSIPIAT